MKLTAAILCLALVSCAESDLLEMSQELWSRVINGGFLRLGRIDPLRVPVIKVDQSEGDTSYRVLLRNLEVTGLNNSKLESVHIVRGRLNSNLSDNEAGYVSYDEARDADSIRYRFHTLVKEPKSNSEDRDLSASEHFEQFMFHEPAVVRASNEDHLAKAPSRTDQRRRYYNDFDPSEGVRRAYPAEQAQDTVFQLYHQPNYGDMRVVMNSTPTNPSQMRVVYTHNYQNAQGDLPRPCVGACKPNYASNVRSGAQNYPSQPPQYPHGAESRSQYPHQDRVNYDGQSTTPGYGIKAEFGGNQRPHFGVKGGQKGGVQYSANFGGSYQPAEQTPNQFSIKGGNSGVNYNGNYKTGPFAANVQSQDNYGSTVQPQQPNQFSAKGGPGSEFSYNVDYKKGPLSVQSQSGDGYGTTGYPQNQYTGSPEAGYTGGYKTGPFADNYASTARPQNQFEVQKTPGSGVSYAFDYGKDPVSIQTGEYNPTEQPQYSTKGSGFSSTKQPQNQFSIKGGNSGLDYSGHYKAGPFSVDAQSGENYGSTGQPQDEYSVKGSNQGYKYPHPGAKYPGQHPSTSGPYGQHHNQYPVKGGQQYGGQNNEDNGAASNNYEVRAQAGGARLSADNSGVTGQSENFGVNYSGSFNNGRFSLQAGNQRDQQKYRADSNSRYTESTTPENYEEFEPYKSPVIRLEKEPSYVDIVYAAPANQGTQPRSGKHSDPRQFGFRQSGSHGDYKTYNYTEGKPLNQRNDAARLAADSDRIDDLLRYAKEYQEEQGFYEEGMEFVYHFGDLSNGSEANESLTRTKRQHKNDTEEEDLMHVMVRLRIPQLGLKSDYALTGKVGQRQLRGGGQLSGNFTDVVADFTVELKRVDNRTMIVRAARAKLVSKDRKLRLQGMDENGPVASILSHGLMAAEAVAAMIADDLATKALNEDNNAETMIYKMYKNLPVLEKS